MPLLRARMAQRKRGGTPAQRAWIGEFLKTNGALRRHILRELERNGPMLSRDLQHDGIPRGLDHRWWGDRPLRLMLEILAGRGEVGVAGRVGKQRLWDLGERVFPPSETLPAARGAARARAPATALARRLARARRLEDAPGHPRRPGAEPHHLPLPLRPARPRPRPRRAPLGLPLPARDVRAEGRSASTATTCCRSSAATGSSAASTSSTCARRRALRVNGVWWEDGVRPVSLTPALNRLARFVGAAPTRG